MQPEELPGQPKVVGIRAKTFKKSCRSRVWIMFFMVEIDSAPSKTSRTPKILKFNNYNLDLQKSLPNFL